MRSPQYISPSAFAQWKKDQEEYYVRYLADNRPPRDPQTLPMSIGSAFDAYVKAEINARLNGDAGKTELCFENLFERSVEKQNRDTAKVDGLRVFQLYESSGALAELISQIYSDVRMEFEVQGMVPSKRNSGLVLMGKPDLSFKTKDGKHILLDWKVNGAYSQHHTSPMKGYVGLRGKDGSHFKCHKDAQLGRWHGIRFNMASTLEFLNETWAQQMAIYAWLCGEPIGGDFLAMIDQIVGRLGEQKIAEHRVTVGRTFQFGLDNDLHDMWSVIRSEHIFRDMTLEDSQARCKLLDLMYVEQSAEDEDMFKSMKPNVFKGTF